MIANDVLPVASRFVALVVGLLLFWMPVAGAQTSTVKLAVISTLTGANSTSYGKLFFDGVRLAVEEANAADSNLRIVLDIQDDRGTEEGAREAATRIVASDALAVVGPMLSTSSLAAGPIFAQAGMASIVSAVESDLVTNNATTFRPNFKNGDLGEWLAAYLDHVLGGKKAFVIFADNGYGRTIADGFRRGADRLGLDATFRAFTDAAGRDEAARLAATAPGKPAIVLATLDADAREIVTALRRQGVDAPILGGTGLAEQAFGDQFKDQPEEKKKPGFFTNGIYAVAPVMLDSANAETLAFAERFRTRYGRSQPSVSWISVQGYDGGRLAVAALRSIARDGKTASLRARREAVVAFVASLDSPLRAVMGVVGPIWFTPDRGRQMPVRVGRFSGGEFESAPLQLVPVARPSAEEIADGTLVDMGEGQYARRQQVVYAGIYLNEIPRVDIAQSIFTADIYVWLRYVRGAPTPNADPTQIEFPDLVRGSFDEKRPVAQRDLDDGTTYRLWRLRGDFKNDFDLRRYPADHQTLSVRFFNGRAASDRLVYVHDRNSFDVPQTGSLPDPRYSDRFGSTAAPAAFRNLTQWEPVFARERRDSLVTASSLGDPGTVGFERVRELSGFDLEVEIKRSIGTTLVKTLLPIGLMTLIMLAMLYFPSTLSAAKVTVSITAGLSGAVLLASINTQLGNVGYVIAVEYVFYVFFALCLLSIVTVMVGEQFRLSGRSATAVDQTGRYLFLAVLLVTTATAWIAVARWQ